MRAAYALPENYGQVVKPGPVSEAIRTMRAADPAFDTSPELRALRRALADRIEADLAALDALGEDADLEPALGSIDATSHSDRMDQEQWSIGGGQDREAGDDTGVADLDGVQEQGFRGYAGCL